MNGAWSIRKGSVPTFRGLLARSVASKMNVTLSCSCGATTHLSGPEEAIRQTLLWWGGRHIDRGHKVISVDMEMPSPTEGTEHQAKMEMEG